MGTTSSKDKRASNKRSLLIMEENVREATQIREMLVYEAHADGLRSQRMIELSTHVARMGSLK